MLSRIYNNLPAVLLLSVGCCLADSGVPALDPTADETDAPPDKCDQVPAQNRLPEKIRSGTHEFSCRTVRWLDSLFGGSEDFEEEAIGGKLTIGLSWNEYEDAKAKARYRVRTDLPNFSSRWDAFFGRVDEEAHISDTENIQASSRRQGISDRDDNEWLLGLGYRERKGATQGWDYSVGLRLRTPIRVYTKARYRKSWQLGPDLDLRFAQTFFWRDGTGFGSTTNLDSVLDRNTLNLQRWSLVSTVSEETDGTRWWAGHTWYHNLGNQRGISLLSFARGETDTEVPLHEYGFELTWRRQLTRDWLFINVGPTLTWPRIRQEEKREASVGFILLFDFEFGRFRS